MLFGTLDINDSLQIKAASPGFAPALFRLIQEERTYLEAWMEWPQKIQVIVDCERYLQEMYLFNQGKQHFFSFIFFQQRLAGSIALLKRDKIHHSAEVAFWKSKQHLPKQEMRLACQTILQYIWQHDYLHRLEIQTLANNYPAKLLTTELGFQKEGCRKAAFLKDGQYHDLEIYGLLKKV